MARITFFEKNILKIQVYNTTLPIFELFRRHKTKNWRVLSSVHAQFHIIWAIFRCTCSFWGRRCLLRSSTGTDLLHFPLLMLQNSGLLWFWLLELGKRNLKMGQCLFLKQPDIGCIFDQTAIVEGGIKEIPWFHYNWLLKAKDALKNVLTTVLW